MPRKMPAGLMELLARKDKQIKSHTTLEVLVDNGDIVRNYYFASSTLMLNGVEFQPLLKNGSQIRSSLTRSADQATVEIHNADTAQGIEFLSTGQALYGASVKVGRYWLDELSLAQYHKVFLTGVVVGLEINENVVKLSAVSEPYAQVSVGATRRVVPSCQWKFRNPLTCGYAGTLLTCNFLLNHIDGCEGRHGGGVGATLKRAKFGGMAFLNSKSRLKTL